MEIESKFKSNDPWIDRSENMKCKTCIWFVPKAPSEERRRELMGGENPVFYYDLGRCRRHCPTIGGFPVVYVNDWCGDHRIDENKLKAG